jgi:hypothetical protein
MVRHGTWCVELDCGWFGKVPHVRTGMVDGLERCTKDDMVCWLGLARIN